MATGKDRALALLSTAEMMESSEDMRKLIERARDLMRDEPEVVTGIDVAMEMIQSASIRVLQNRPAHDDTPSTRAEKIAICESGLLQIIDYAKSGLKARAQGSLEVAESLLQLRQNRSLEDFAEAKAMARDLKSFMKENDATMEVKLHE